MLERLMMRPNFASIMCFWTAFDIRNAPRRCTAITRSQSSTVILNNRLSRMMPALLTSTVGAPSSSATAETAASTAAGSLTSAPTAMAVPPFAALESTVACAASCWRSRTATFMPSSDKRWAMAAPMPCAAPVTMAVRASDTSEPQLSADELLHDLVGSSPDLRDAGVTPGACDSVLVHEAVAAMDLDAGVDDLALDLGGPPLRLGRLHSGEFLRV